MLMSSSLSISFKLVFFRISFLSKESKDFHDSFNSLLKTFFKESVFISFLLSSKNEIVFASLFESPFFNELNFSTLLENPKIKKKRIETVK